MGVYANFEDVIYGGPADAEGETCTACRNTGVVAFPINVGQEVNEYDPCPYGCVEDDEETLPVQNWPQRQGWWPSRFQLAVGRIGNEWAAVHPKQKKLIGASYMAPLDIQGRVTTDEPAVGYSDELKCTVPAYLPGRPIELDEDRWLTVEYEHMGSKMQITFLPTEAHKFRFAHPWDTGTSTQEVLT